MNIIGQRFNIITAAFSIIVIVFLSTTFVPPVTGISYYTGTVIPGTGTGTNFINI
jgi:hypothetical protein